MLKRITATTITLMLLLAVGAAAQTVPPTLDPIGPQAIDEGATLNFTVTASDGDGTTPSLSAIDLPAGASFIDNANGTGSFSWTPTFADSGSYDLTFRAADPVTTADTTIEVVTITVNQVNQAPVLAPIGNQSGDEGTLITFGVTASDPDGFIPTLTTSTLPGTASFVDNGNGTGTFSWTPTLADSGNYSITFTATDDSLATDAETITVRVDQLNQAPVLAAIGDQSGDEGTLITFGVTASDPDGFIPTLTTSTLPGTASFIDNGNGTGTFSWTPTLADSGDYSITFTATDDSTVTDDETITVRVDQVNQAPVLDPIGAQGGPEGSTIAFTVTTSDPDGIIPTLSATNLPTGASFIDNANGTGSFSWPTTLSDAGTYNVTFTSTDDSLVTDQEIVTITVGQVNQPPVLAAIGDQSGDEGTLITFGVSASDPDGFIPTLTTSTLPGTASFVDNGNGTGTFSWTPTLADSGNYSITFTATDDSLATDAETITVRVDQVNQAPVLAAIGDQSGDEGTLITFGVTASDPDGFIPTLTTSALPGTASFIDNGNGTGTFSWTPTLADSGDYSITFTATDDSTVTDDETITVRVDQVNQAPVLDPIGAQGGPEGSTIAFTVTTSDPDGIIPTLSATNLPTGASFVDNANGTGSFSWPTTLSDAGTYNVTFTSTDDSLVTDQEIVTITVGQVNQPPVLAAIGDQSGDEGTLITFGVSASDPDGFIPTLTTSTLPGTASFVDNGNGTGTFSWTPTLADSGNYSITFTATDDSLATDAETITVRVDQVNQTPTLAAIGAQSGDENQLLTFVVSASDPDGFIPTLTTSALPGTASFVDNGNGTGTFSWTPTFADAGLYNVTFTATDDSSTTDSEVVAITINNINQPPVLAPIGPQSGTEGALVSFTVTATDGDGTIPTLSGAPLPTGASFVDNANGTGTFTWTPSFTDAGVYNITFTATDDSSATDSEIVALTIGDAGNQLPVFAPQADINIDEGATGGFTVSATDADLETPVLTILGALPANAGFVDNGNGSGDFTFSPDFTQRGSYPISFVATDGSGGADTLVVTVTVDGINVAPVLAAIGGQSGAENTLITFGVSATDANGTTPSLSAAPLPTGASFVDNGNGTGTFSWTPTFADQGSYPITFTATDDSLTTDTELVTVTVGQVNLPPVLDPIGARAIDENALLSFTVTASDPDGTIPTLTTTTLPGTATFVDNGNGTGTFSWTPSLADSGDYSVTFTATDDSLVTDTEVVAIRVNQVNQAPVLSAIGNRSVNENVLLSFSVTASDPDGVIPSLGAAPLPTGATFVDNLDGTGTFSWTPTFTDQGTYNLTFTASDDSLATDSEAITITVNQINQPPVLDPIGPQSVIEGNTLNFTVTATDIDGQIPTLGGAPIPTGATYVDNGNGTATFNWPTTFNDAGVYNVNFTAIDDSGSIDNEVVSISVIDAGNQPPVFDPQADTTVAEGGTVVFTVSATDPEGTTPTFSSLPLPANASLVDNFNGTATVTFNPDFTQRGSYPFTLFAIDGGSARDTLVVTVTVTGVNVVPVLSAIGPQGGDENTLISFAVTATDDNGTNPTLTAVPLPTGASFVDNGDGTGLFTWTPTFADQGAYPITFTATDDSLTTDSEVVTVTVNQINLPPVLAAIGNQAGPEGQLLTFNVSASDPDGTIPTLSTTALPTGASFVDNLDGTGTFTWTPTLADSGNYALTITATDDSLATSSEAITIRIDQVNQTPVLTPIGNRTVNENVLLSFTVSASDADGVIPTLTALPLPTGASFVDNLDGTGTFSWTPTFDDSGAYAITFTATDDSLTTASELITITVNNINQPPVLDPIGPQGGIEGSTVSFTVTASDPDNTIPLLTAAPLPTGATFTDNLNGTGTFSWPTTFNDAGSYPITFSAIDDSAITDIEVVVVSITDAGNQPPIFAAQADTAILENQTLTLTVSAIDPEGGTPSISLITPPANASLVDNNDGTGTLTFTPDSTQQGVVPIRFLATDPGFATDTLEVNVTVGNVNVAPALAAIGPRSGDEGALLSFVVSASDFDGTIPTLSAAPLPGTATFLDNLDGTGTFSWTPTFTDSGTYAVTFTATDDSLLTDTELVTITINNVNQPPVLAPIGNQVVAEGALLSFTVTATDDDGVIPTLSAAPLPGAATFVDNLDGTGTFTWTPGFTEAGSYPVTFTATDDSLATATELVTITVTDGGNQAPIFAAQADTSIDEAATLTLTVSATDPDTEIPTLTALALPANAAFVDNLDGTGTLTFSPDFAQSGLYPFFFIATDAGLLADTLIVNVTVNEINEIPVLAAIGAQAGPENALLTFTVTATDADATIPVLSASPLPVGAAFVDNLDGTGTFSWTPTLADSGTYAVLFVATDALFPTVSDTETVTITIVDANEPPVLSTIGPQFVQEGDTITFGFTAVDPNLLDAVTFAAANVPPNASLFDSLNGAGSFTFAPDFTQGDSTYDVLIIATDGQLSDTELVAITVSGAGNQPPVIAPLADTTVLEGGTLAITISAVDPDGLGTFPTLSISSGLNNATFVDNGDGTGLLTYTPTFLDAGTDTIRVFAADQGTPIATGTATFFITTIDVNQPPDIVPDGPFVIQTLRELAVTIVATDSTDPNTGNRIFLQALSLPLGASFVDNGDGTGSFTWTPDTNQIGADSLVITATDEGTPALASQATFLIDVRQVNIPPNVIVASPYVVGEGQSLSFPVGSIDPDNGPIVPMVLSVEDLPDGATFTDNLDGTGQFDWTPSFVQAGLYAPAFRAFDGVSVGREVVFIQVLEAGNQVPVFGTLPSDTVTEGSTVVSTVTATDPEGGVVQMAVVNGTLPANATTDQVADGVLEITFSPDFTQSGTVLIDVEASDGVSADTATITITVFDAGNQLPILAAIGPQSVTELNALNFVVTGSDPDGVAPVLTADPLPAGATYTDNNDGTANFSWIPSDVQSGSYDILFLAEDAAFPGVADSELVTITVADTNRLPFIFTSGSRTIAEGDTLEYTVFTTDPDGTIPSLGVTLDGEDTLATNMVFVDSGNGAGTLFFTPNFQQGATPSQPYFVKFFAVDADDPALIREQTGNILISVENRNQPPSVFIAFGGPGPFSILEGETLGFTMGAVDSDGVVAPTFTSPNLPTGATFDVTANANQSVGTFAWTPNFTQAGVYAIEFLAVDVGGDSTTLIVDVTVGDAGNQPPQFVNPLDSNLSIPVGRTTSLRIEAYDPEGGAVVLSAAPLAAGMTFVDSGNGIGTLTYTPDSASLGTISGLTITATDPFNASSQIASDFVVVTFLRGDVDGLNGYSIGDLVFLLNYLFRGGDDPEVVEAADVNSDDRINVGDVTYLIQYIYFDGLPPGP